MKKFLLSALCLLGFSAMYADEAEIVFADQGYANAEVLTTVTVNDDLILTFNKGSNSNEPKYYNTGTGARLYGGNTLSVQCLTGNLQEVVFYTQSSNPLNAASTVTFGDISVGKESSTWTGNVADFTLTQGGTSGHARIQKITFVYGGDAPIVRPAAPTFDPAAGIVEAGTLVSIATVTEGAEIHYTVDGNEATADSPLYTLPIEVNESMTIRAIAVKDGVCSSEVSAAYVVPTVYHSLAEVAALEDKAEFAYEGVLTTVYVNGAYNYVYDGDTYALLYKSNLGLEAGSKIVGSWTGKVSVYNGLIELVPASELTVDGTAEIPAPLEVTGDNFDEVWSLSMMNSYMLLKEVEAVSDGENVTYSLAGNEITLYKRFGVDLPGEGTWNVLGFLAVYKTNLQLYVCQFTETTGVESISTSNNAAAEYFNLQGVRVVNPEHGFYIRRQGSEVSKVVIR